jgi:hypothetical protein
LGVFDASENRYFITVPGVTGSESFTISFSEQKNGFESFHTFIPELMGNVGTLMVTFKDGALWTHDSTMYSNYYGVQYKPRVKLMFNDVPMMKKTLQAATYIAGSPWFSPEVNTSLGRRSRIPMGHWRKKEDAYHAYFLRDLDSQGGLMNGAMLKGNWVEVTFEKYDGSTGEEFHYGEVKYSVSNLNAR